MGGTPCLRRDPAPQRLAALAQGRCCRCRTKLFRLARLGAPPAGEILGAAHSDEPRTLVAEPGQAPEGIWAARPGLRLVHRGLRHQGSARGEVAPRGAQVGTEHILLALADVASASRPGRPAGMYHKPWDAVGEVGVGRLFPEMTPRQPAPTFGLKVRFTDDPGVWRQIG